MRHHCSLPNPFISRNGNRVGSSGGGAGRRRESVRELMEISDDLHDADDNRGVPDRLGAARADSAGNLESVSSVFRAIPGYSGLFRAIRGGKFIREHAFRADGVNVCQRQFPSEPIHSRISRKIQAPV